MNDKMYKVIRENKLLILKHIWVIGLLLIAIISFVGFIVMSIIYGWHF